MPKLEKGLVWAICSRCGTRIDLEDIDPGQGCAGDCPACHAYVFVRKEHIPGFEELIEYLKFQQGTGGRSPSAGYDEQKHIEYKKFQQKTGETLRDILNENKLAIFAGAGISKDSPCDLPSWSELAHSLLRELSKQDPSRRYDGVVERLIELALPPNLIIDEIAYFHEFGCKTMISEFLKQANYNRHHLRLALLLNKVRVITTTNYDNCIEQALDASGIRYERLISDKDFLRGAELLYKSDYPPMLAKLHGDVSEPSTIMGTLSELRRGLPGAKRLFMRALLENRHILFIGYSGNDLYLDDNYLLMKHFTDTSYGFTWNFHPGAQPSDVVKDLVTYYNSKGKKADITDNTLDSLLTSLYPYGGLEIDEVQVPRGERPRAKTIYRWPETSGIPLPALVVAELLLHTGQIDACEGVFNELAFSNAQSYTNRVRLAGILGLMRVAKYRGNHSRVLELSKQGPMQKVRIPASKEERFLYAFLRLGESGSLSATGEIESALHATEEACRIFKDLGAYFMVVKALGEHSLNLGEIGRIKDSEEMLKDALQLAIDFGDVKSEGSIYNNFGLLYYHHGEYKNGLDMINKALKTADSIADVQGLCIALANKGLFLRHLGQLDEAYISFRRSSEIATEHHMLLEIGQAENGMGTIEYQRQNYDAALNHWHKALDIYRTTSNFLKQMEVLNNYAEVLRIGGRPSLAIQAIDLALTLVKDKKFELRAAPYHHTKGMILLDTERYAEAIVEFESASACHRKNNNRNHMRMNYTILVLPCSYNITFNKLGRSSQMQSKSNVLKRMTWH